MTLELINYKKTQQIAYISLNRPEKRNALNHQLVSELKETLDIIENDDTVKAVVLKGEGKAFCAGADLAYIQDLQNYTYEENLEDSNHLKDLFLKNLLLPQNHNSEYSRCCNCWRLWACNCL